VLEPAGVIGMQRKRGLGAGDWALGRIALHDVMIRGCGWLGRGSRRPHHASPKGRGFFNRSYAFAQVRGILILVGRWGIMGRPAANG
jgi:hypothetical protein